MHSKYGYYDHVAVPFYEKQVSEVYSDMECSVANRLPQVCGDFQCFFADTARANRRLHEITTFHIKHEPSGSYKERVENKATKSTSFSGGENEGRRTAI